MPPAGAGWRVGIVTGDDKAFGACRDVIPRQMRGNIIAVVAHAVKDMAARQFFTVFEIVTD
ncbi:hypothetical protein GM30_09640 [Trabulsiella odontotermitis]|nr:hypothetical protein GM30_09640 [Trabulsiella odontotermitis]